MIGMEWEGKAVSKNRALQPGRGRLVPTTAYAKFMESLVYTWICQTRRNCAYKAMLPFSRYSVKIKVSVGPRMDPQNVNDAVLDSLEKANVIENDRNLGDFHMSPLPAHKQGEMDRIIVMVKERGKC